MSKASRRLISPNLPEEARFLSSPPLQKNLPFNTDLPRESTIAVLWPPREEKKSAGGPKCFGCVNRDKGASSGFSGLGLAGSGGSVSSGVIEGVTLRNGCVGSTHLSRSSLNNTNSVSSSSLTGRSGGSKPSLYQACMSDAFHGPVGYTP